MIRQPLHNQKRRLHPARRPLAPLTVPQAAEKGPETDLEILQNEAARSRGLSRTGLKRPSLELADFEMTLMLDR